MVLIFNSWVIDEALGVDQVESTEDELGGARGEGNICLDELGAASASDNTVMQRC